jgi:hypothetical protein
MTTEDLLIDACDSMGYGVDINYLCGTVQVNMGKGAGRKFSSLSSALKFVQAIQAQMRSF